MLDLQLARKRGRGAEGRAVWLDRQPTKLAYQPSPTIAPSDVLARAHEPPSDVVRRVLDPLVVVGPAGGQHRVADAGAVELELEHPARGRVQRRPPHLAADRERPAEVRGRSAAGAIM